MLQTVTGPPSARPKLTCAPRGRNLRKLLRCFFCNRRLREITGFGPAFYDGARRTRARAFTVIFSAFMGRRNPERW